MEIELIKERIFIIRGEKVMLSSHLVTLYGVSTKALIQAVKRNSERFPQDFMFQLTWEESKGLRSQIVTLEKHPHLKYRPYAFTEQGIAMLSSVLRSKQAIEVKIAIMRIFVKIKKLLISNKDLEKKLEDLERKYSKHDQEIQNIFQVIRQLITPPEKSRRKIGFQ